MVQPLELLVVIYLIIKTANLSRVNNQERPTRDKNKLNDRFFFPSPRESRFAIRVSLSMKFSMLQNMVKERLSLSKSLQGYHRGGLQ